jgi:hypothetical protein
MLRGMPPNSEFSIVVVGRMNPAIHHPVWYHATNKLVDETEFAAAMDGGVVICTPEVSRFSFNEVAVLCVSNSWRVTTLGDPERAVILASRLFEALQHAPISRYGVNFDVRMDAAEGRLASLVDLSDLLPGSACEIQARSETGLGGQYWARLVQGPGGCISMNNFEYVRPENEPLFKLAPLLRSAFEEADRLTRATLRLTRATLFAEEEDV